MGLNTLCPSDYQRNGFVATHALGHMLYGSIRTLFLYPLEGYKKIQKNCKIKLKNEKFQLNTLKYMFIISIFILLTTTA